jgi:3-oxoacyl-[acyl-carrier-protein] synthase II
MNKEDAIVTGIGPISCIGKSASELWQNILKGFSGIERLTEPWIVPGTASLVGSVVKDFNIRNYTNDQSILSLLDDKNSRTTQLGIASALQAVKDAGLDLSAINRERVGSKISLVYSLK